MKVAPTSRFCSPLYYIKLSYDPGRVTRLDSRTDHSHPVRTLAPPSSLAANSKIFIATIWKVEFMSWRPGSRVWASGLTPEVCCANVISKSSNNIPPATYHSQINDLITAGWITLGKNELTTFGGKERNRSANQKRLLQRKNKVFDPKVRKRPLGRKGTWKKGVEAFSRQIIHEKQTGRQCSGYWGQYCFQGDLELQQVSVLVARCVAFSIEITRQWLFFVVLLLQHLKQLSAVLNNTIYAMHIPNGMHTG